jgi:hypothetical protein
VGGVEEPGGRDGLLGADVGQRHQGKLEKSKGDRFISAKNLINNKINKKKRKKKNFKLI